MKLQKMEELRYVHQLLLMMKIVNLTEKLISKEGGYIEIFVNTPLEKCEERDSKGLYAWLEKEK